MNKALRKQLMKMMKKDQKMRKKGPWDIKIYKENTKKLKTIIKKYGWPDIKLVGKNGSLAAWLIAQHADHDIKFQQQCLNLIREKLKDNLVDKRNVAYLTDRVLVNQGKPQIYGTQFYVNKRKKFTYRPIKDKRNLDLRRENVGLEPFKKYYKRMLKLYNK